MSKFIHIVVGCKNLPVYSEDIEADVSFVDAMAQKLFPGLNVHGAHCDGELFTFHQEKPTLNLLDSVSVLLDSPDADDNFSSYFGSSPEELKRFLASYPKDPVTNRRHCIVLYIPLDIEYWDVYKRVVSDNDSFGRPAWVFNDTHIPDMEPRAIVEGNAKEIWDQCISFNEQKVREAILNKGFSDADIIKAYRALMASQEK